MSNWPALSIRGTELTPDETREHFTTYARRHAATVREYDLRHDPEPNIVTVTDLGRMILINARLTGDDAATLLELANPPHSDWTRFETGVSITEPIADPADSSAGSLWNAMQHQYTVLDKEGLGHAKITKLLHLKRPALFPIIDSFVRSFYRDCGITSEWWAHIRADVIANAAAFGQLRSAAAESGDPAVAHLARLADLRLHDIAIWSIIEQGKRA